MIDAFGDKMLCPILKSVLKWNLVYYCTSQFTIADFKCDWCIWWQNVHSRQCHLNIMRMQNPHFYLTWAACSRYASMTHLQLDNWYGLWNRHCKNHVCNDLALVLVLKGQGYGVHPYLCKRDVRRVGQKNLCFFQALSISDCQTETLITRASSLSQNWVLNK